MKKLPTIRLLVIMGITVVMGLISFFIIFKLSVHDPTLKEKKILERSYRLSVVGEAIREFYSSRYRLPASLDEILPLIDEEKRAMILNKKEESYSWMIIGETITNPTPGETNKYFVCRVIQVSSGEKTIMTKKYIEIKTETLE